MPAVLKIDRQRRIVCSTFYGEVTDQELLRHRNTILEDPDFSPEFSEIVDFSAVTRLTVSEATLSAMAGSNSIYSKSAVHIIVAPADAAFELARKYRELTRQSRPSLFLVRSLVEAYKLLGVELGR